jgi:hypothetical protein
MKGNSGIPALQLEILNKLIEIPVAAPSNYFSSMFGTQNYDSDKIRWEYEYGSGGITPFVAPGSPAPVVGVDGTGSASASSAYWKEKTYFDEAYLNNLKQPGTFQTYQTAERTLARQVLKLRNRCLRRREWMVAKMFCQGGFTYKDAKGMSFTVDYGVPSTHKVTLSTNYKWGTGSSRNPIDDVMTAKNILSIDAQVMPGMGILNTNLINTLVKDTNIQALLAKSQFGNGDLFSRPAEVIGALLNMPIRIYDDFFTLQGWILQNVAAAATTIYLDDVTDFEIGGIARIQNMKNPRVWEDLTINAVDPINGTIGVVTGPANAYVAGRDRVIMRKRFIDDNTFVMFSDKDGQGMPVAEFMQAPYGIDRHWGMFVDTDLEWDPEGIWLRVQDKGMPVYYNPDTTYIMTVR